MSSDNVAKKLLWKNDADVAQKLWRTGFPKSGRQSVLQVSMGFHQMNESQDLMAKHMIYSREKGSVLVYAT